MSDNPYDQNRGIDGVRNDFGVHGNLNWTTRDAQIRSGASQVSDPNIASMMVANQLLADQSAQNQSIGGYTGPSKPFPWKKAFLIFGTIGALIFAFYKGSEMYEVYQYQKHLYEKHFNYLAGKFGATEAKARLAARKDWGNEMWGLGNDTAPAKAAYEWTKTIPFGANKAEIIAHAIDTHAKPGPVLQAAALDCMMHDFCRPDFTMKRDGKNANPEAVAAKLYQAAIRYQYVPGIEERERESICMTTAMMMRDSAYDGVPGASLKAAVDRVLSCYGGNPDPRAKGTVKEFDKARAALKTYLAEGGKG